MSHLRRFIPSRSALPAAAGILLATLQSGCASHINFLCNRVSPTNTFVNVDSTPQGALAQFSDGRTVTTPGQVVVRSNQPITVTITKQGYKPEQVQLGPGLNPWIFGNLLAVPPFGFIIDAEQSAYSRTYSSGIHVELVSLADAKAAAEAPPPAN